MTTQTDRELLELAAKAAGVVYDGYEEDDGCDRWFVPELSRYTNWNPLTDDGDALRLAVKLKIPMQFPDWRNVARTWGPDDSNETFDETAFDHDGDLFAATRRAIVRAAAAIGSAM